MSCSRLSAFTVAALTVASLALSAKADIELTLNVEEYDDFFKRCDFKIEHSASDGIDLVSLVYNLDLPGKGGAICRTFLNGSTCQSTDDLAYTCEDMEQIDILATKCATADGSAVACGAVTLGASKNTSASLAMPDQSGNPDTDVQVFPKILGDDDFFNACEIAFTFAGPTELRKVEVDFTTPIGDRGERTCEASIGHNGGYGLGCSGTFGLEFTCAEVTTVSIDAVRCEGEDGEVDCGTVSVRTTEPDVFIDAR